MDIFVQKDIPTICKELLTLLKFTSIDQTIFGSIAIDKSLGVKDLDIAILLEDKSTLEVQKYVDNLKTKLSTTNDYAGLNIGYQLGNVKEYFKIIPTEQAYLVPLPLRNNIFKIDLLIITNREDFDIINKAVEYTNNKLKDYIVVDKHTRVRIYQEALLCYGWKEQE